MVSAALLAALLPGAALAKVPVGAVRPARIDSPHPVAGPWRQEILRTGASFLKLHLDRVSLGESDLLLVQDGLGRQVASVEGPYEGALWLPSAEGDSLALEI